MHVRAWNQGNASYIRRAFDAPPRIDARVRPSRVPAVAARRERVRRAEDSYFRARAAENGQAAP